MIEHRPAWQKVFSQANIADLVILTPFAVPFVADLYLGIWRHVSALLSPGRPLSGFTSDAMLFVNLAGAFAVCLICMRIKLGTQAAARMTGIFKLCAAGIFALALGRGASLIFAVPLLADAIIGVLLLVTTRRS
jgi:hypothetical protein